MQTDVDSLNSVNHSSMFLFYFFAVILIYFSYKSFRGGIAYLNFFRQELLKSESNFTPFVSIIAPCRGMDEGLEENLAALFEQDFPVYEIVFAVDSASDDSVETIEKLRAKFQNIKSKLIIAGKAETESQKVHNLRESVLRVSIESKIFVFVDSDARPAKNWLRNLIAPLQNENVGCTTGYRWFISKNFGFASEMRSVWNASIASALGANAQSNFCWGGSMAMRRETFDKLEMREKWRGVLSDDFAVTRAMKAANLPIYFVPQALTASVENCSFGELLEFTTRQMKITRVYAPKLWLVSFIGSGLFSLAWIWGMLLIFLNSVNTFEFWFAFITLLLVSVFSVGKSWLRLNAVKLILKKYEKDLTKQFWTQNTFWIFSQPLFFYNSVCALFSNEICWRGIKYKLMSSSETIVGRNDKRL